MRLDLTDCFNKLEASCPQIDKSSSDRGHVLVPRDHRPAHIARARGRGRVRAQDRGHVKTEVAAEVRPEVVSGVMRHIHGASHQQTGNGELTAHRRWWYHHRGRRFVLLLYLWVVCLFST